MKRASVKHSPASIDLDLDANFSQSLSNRRPFDLESEEQRMLKVN